MIFAIQCTSMLINWKNIFSGLLLVLFKVTQSVYWFYYNSLNMSVDKTATRLQNVGRKNTEKIIIEYRNVSSAIVKLKVVK